MVRIDVVPRDSPAVIDGDAAGNSDVVGKGPEAETYTRALPGSIQRDEIAFAIAQETVVQGVAIDVVSGDGPRFVDALGEGPVE